MAKGDFTNNLREFMRGRNGQDDITRCALAVTIVLIVIDLFARTGWLAYVEFVLLAYCWFRLMSRNVAARARENEKFMSALGPVRPWVVSPTAAFAEARGFRHLTCPSCGQKVRVPRGKGKIRITCPSCHEHFEGKS